MKFLTNRLMHASAGHDDPPAGAARRGNRRRLAVFGGVFAVCLVAGQAWNFLRADVYRASSRLKIVLPDAGGASAAVGSGAGVAGAAATAQATQLQTLTGRPLLAKLAAAMAATGQGLPTTVGDPAAHLQSMLQVLPVAGTDVLQVEATGPMPAQLAALLNSLPQVAMDEMAAYQAQAADTQVEGARTELQRLERLAGDRRAQLERFRSTAGIQADRDENEAVARNKGLNAALNTAIEREAAAEARLRTLSEGGTSARSGQGARDDATLTGMEGRASQAREELRDMERLYTPDFMAMDPRARALRARLAELERQIADQRVAGQQLALTTAQQDLDTARATVERLRSALAAGRPTLASAAVQIGEAKTLEDDLAQVEKARRELLERVVRLEANPQRRVPTVTVMEAATVPTVPFLPDRWHDGLLVLAGSLGLALLAMGLVEVFNRPAASTMLPGTTTVVMPAAWGQTGPAGPAYAALPAGVGPGSDAPSAAGLPALALPAPPQVLRQEEAAALLSAAQGPTRWLVAGALMGLDTAELLALRATDIDSAAGRLTVRGAWARQLPVPGWLAASLPLAGHAVHTGDAAAADAAAAPLLRDASNQPLTEDDLRSMLACAALDAGLPQGADLQPGVLRNTCIDWLVGQGLRFSDLAALVGRLDPGQIAAFAGRAAEGPRRGVADVDPLMPAVRMPPLA